MGGTAALGADFVKEWQRGRARVTGSSTSTLGASARIARLIVNHRQWKCHLAHRCRRLAIAGAAAPSVQGPGAMVGLGVNSIVKKSWSLVKPFEMADGLAHVDQASIYVSASPMASARSPESVASIASGSLSPAEN